MVTTRLIELVGLNGLDWYNPSLLMNILKDDGRNLSPVNRSSLKSRFKG